MRKALFTITLFALICANAFAQEKNRELYITNDLLSWNLTQLNFGLEYKSQLKDNLYLRLRANSLNFSSGVINDQNDLEKVVGRYYNGAAGLGVGLEKRKSLSDNIMFFNGLNLHGFYSTNFQKFTDPAYSFVDQATKNYSIYGRFSYHAGMYINLKERLLLGVQYEPAIYYNRVRRYTGDDLKFSNDVFGATLSLTNISLMLGIRWHK